MSLMNNLIAFPRSWASSAYAEETAAAEAAAARERQAYQDLMDHPKWAFVAYAFESTIGWQLKPWQLLELVELNQDEQLIFAAIQDTRKAPRPSYFYLRAILTRCKASGINNLNAYVEDHLRHQTMQDSRYRRAAT